MSDLSALIRDAAAAGRGVRVIGAGTWTQGGRPVSSATTISVGDDRGIVEYVPGDLTLTARAGTRLSEIGTATRAQGQWLPLEPWGTDAGTIGATVSTATSGPHAHAMGLPRDVVLGLEFVTGTGDVVRSGGRVVKNVAGFDLTRLLVGSWGTLGVITEVTVRLRARPDRIRSVALHPTRLDELPVELRALPFTPLASELISDALARHLDAGDGPTLLVQIGGNERSLGAQLDLLARLGSLKDADDGIWDRLRALDGAASWRCSSLPANFGATWRVADTGARASGGFAHGNPARGIARVVVGDAAGVLEKALATTAAFDGTVAIESLPERAWAAVDFAPARDAVSRAIRSKFDPAGILNPGILGGGPP